MKTNRFRRKIIMIIIIFFIIMGAIYSKGFLSESNQLSFIPEENLKKDLGIPIEIAEVKEKTLIKKITYIGTVESQNSVQLSANVPGQIMEINFQEGELVKKGDIVATLDDRHIRAKMNTTDAKIERNRLNRDYLLEEEFKYQTLLEEGAISESAYKKIKHEKDMAEAQLQELHAVKNELLVSLDEAIIKSPIDGKIRQVNYDPGDMAMTGKPIIVIDEISSLSVTVNIPESDLNKIHKDTPAILKISGFTEIIETNVKTITPSINPETRVGKMELKGLDIDTQESYIMGASVLVEFIIEEIDYAIVIPESAIKELSQKKVVYLIKDGNVEETPVKIGSQDGKNIQILEGLKIGDQVANGNLNKLYDGAKVYIFEGDQIL